MKVNGKTYPLWGQFVEKQNEWVGGILDDSGDSMDRALGMKGMTTKIKEIKLRENGDTSAFFEVIGNDFSCGFGVEYGGIVSGEEGWITFSGYGGHTWRISKTKIGK